MIVHTGGTSEFEGASGYLDYLGMADSYQNTLVRRYLLRALAENGRVSELSEREQMT